MNGPPERGEGAPCPEGALTESSQHNGEDEGTRKMGTLSTGVERIVSIAPASDWFLSAYRPGREKSDGFFVRTGVALWATIRCPGQPDRLEAFVTEGAELVPASDYWNGFAEEATLVRADEFCDCRWPKGHGGRVPPPGDLCRACGLTVPPGVQE